MNNQKPIIMAHSQQKGGVQREPPPEDSEGPSRASLKSPSSFHRDQGNPFKVKEVVTQPLKQNTPQDNPLSHQHHIFDQPGQQHYRGMQSLMQSNVHGVGQQSIAQSAAFGGGNQLSVRSLLQSNRQPVSSSHQSQVSRYSQASQIESSQLNEGPNEIFIRQFANTPAQPDHLVSLTDIVLNTEFSEKHSPDHVISSQLFSPAVPSHWSNNPLVQNKGQIIKKRTGGDNGVKQVELFEDEQIQAEFVIYDHKNTKDSKKQQNFAKAAIIEDDRPHNPPYWRLENNQITIKCEDVEIEGEPSISNQGTERSAHDLKNPLNNNSFNQNRLKPMKQGTKSQMGNFLAIGDLQENNLTFVRHFQQQPSKKYQIDQDVGALVSLGSKGQFSRKDSKHISMTPKGAADNAFLQALEGEIGLNDNPIATGTMSQYDESARNFEGFETPRSSRIGGRGFSITVDTQNRENQAVRQPSMNEVIIENQNLQVVDTQSDGYKKKISDRQSQPTLQYKKSLMISKYDPKSLFFFKQEWWIRQVIIKIVDSRIFESLMVIVILMNSLSLSLYDYNDRDSVSHFNQILDLSNVIFTGVFIFEASVKIIARGLVFHPQSYLRNGWNLIDSVVVVSGIIELVVGSVKLKALRVIRVFRPLKTINVIPSMKKLISALIHSLPDFANVGIFLIYVFILFATMGVHQYNGSIYNVCRYNEKPENKTHWAFDASFGRPCSTSGNGNFICPNGMYCGNHEEHMEIPFDSENIGLRDYINFGITNFDNLFTSLLSVFQIINSDTWYQYLLNFMDVDIPVFGVIFVISMIIVGQFFLMNLILAVIIFSFIKTQKMEIEDEIKQLNNDDIKIDTPPSMGTQPDGVRDTLGVTMQTQGAIDVIREEPEEHEQDGGEGGQGSQRHGDPNGHKGKKRHREKKKEDGGEMDLKGFLKPQIQKRKVANLFIENRKQHMLQIDGNDSSITGPLQDISQNSPLVGLEAQDSAFRPIRENLIEEEVKIADSDLASSNNNNQGQGEPSASVSVSAISPFDNQTAENASHIPFQHQTEIEPEHLFINPLPNAKISNKILEKLQKSKEKTIVNPILEINPGLQNRRDIKQNLAAIKANQEQTEKEILEIIKKNTRDLQNSKDVSNQIGSGSPKNRSGSQLSSGGAAILSRLGGGIIGQNEEQEDEYGNKPQLNMSSSTNTAILRAQTNQMMRVFRRFIQKKVAQEYEIYFKSMLQDAKDYSHEKFNAKTNIREVVGLRVGLDYIKSQQVNLKAIEYQNLIEKRTASNRLYAFAFNLQEKGSFEAFMVFCILVNTLLLSLDRYPDDPEETLIMEKINIFFTVIFTVEMIIKLFAIGFKHFFISMFNLFDCLVVISGLVDIFLAQFLIDKEIQNDNSDSRSIITGLRGFRLMRIFKLARSWKRFEILIETLGRTLVDIATFSILLFLFIVTYTLLGLELFANRAKFSEDDQVDLTNGSPPKYNFDRFMNSFTTVFIVLTNDGISTIFYDYYRSVGPVAAILFFISLVIIGQKILLNLFIAILLENFDEGVLKQKMHEYEQQEQEKNQLKNGLGNRNILQRADTFIKGIKKGIKRWVERMEGQDEVEEISEENKTKIIKNLKLMAGKSGSKIKKQLSNIEGLLPQDPILQGKAFGLISTQNRCRQILFNIVTSQYFDYFIIAVIILSAVQLALDSPLQDPNSNFKTTLFWIDVGTTIVFVFEAILKIFAFGFLVNGNWSYLRQTWNQLDFLIIIFSLLSIGPVSEKFKTIKVFRILRSMRLISKNEQLKVAVRALFYAVPNVANITIIMLLFFLIFGVIAVSYFKGKFYYCTSPHEDLEHFLRSKWDCLNSGGDWLNRFYTFDDSVSALLVLFVTSTAAGWSELMMLCATSTQIDYLPVPDSEASIIWIIFFIVFVIVGCFFFINLFVGVVISTFNIEHDKIGGNNLLTEKQKEWIDLRLLVLRSEPMRKLRSPESNFRAALFRIQESKWFENLTTACIIANTIVLMVKWYEQPYIIEFVTEILNYIFTALFFAEAVIKIIAIAPRVYFSDGWNIFDTVIILGSFVSIFISANTSLEIKGVITILRSFRILRLLRLIKRGNSLRLIFNTFVITLHSLANIGGLLLLFIFMYSILGMILFGTVKRNGQLNDYINFENFNNAYLTLFVVATGDSWNSIMQAYALENSPSSMCVVNPTYQEIVQIGHGQAIGCGDRGLANAYFISYMFVVNLIFLKIFIAIILQGYNDMQTQDGRLFNIDMNEKFRDTWKVYDPDATTFIKMNDLRDFLFALGAPLGFDRNYRNRQTLQDQFIASLELPTYMDFSSYQFLDVLDALSFRLMVLDHIQQLQTQDTGVANKKSLPSQAPRVINQQEEADIKESLLKEVNRLLYQKRNENIMAVKEVFEKEVKRLKHKKQNQDSKGFTSQHHMAAEATIRKIRQFLKIRNKQRRQAAGGGGDFSDSLIDDRSRGSYWPGIEINQDDVADARTLNNNNNNNSRETGLIDRAGVFLRSITGRRELNRHIGANFRKDKSQQNLQHNVPGLDDDSSSNLNISRIRKESEGPLGLNFKFNAPKNRTHNSSINLATQKKKVYKSNNNLQQNVGQVFNEVQESFMSRSRQSPRFAGANSRIDQSLRNHPLISHDTFAQQLQSIDQRNALESPVLQVSPDGRLILEEIEEYKEHVVAVSHGIVNSNGELLGPDSSMLDYPSNRPQGSSARKDQVSTENQLSVHHFRR